MQCLLYTPNTVNAVMQESKIRAAVAQKTVLMPTLCDTVVIVMEPRIFKDAVRATVKLVLITIEIRPQDRDVVTANRLRFGIAAIKYGVFDEEMARRPLLLLTVPSILLSSMVSLRACNISENQSMLLASITALLAEIVQEPV